MCYISIKADTILKNLILIAKSGNEAGNIMSINISGQCCYDGCYDTENFG